MLKKPLKKSSAVFFINLHVSTKVRYVAATLAPDSLLNPPKFFLRFVNGRMALSLARKFAPKGLLVVIYATELRLFDAIELRLSMR